MSAISAPPWVLSIQTQLLVWGWWCLYHNYFVHLWRSEDSLWEFFLSVHHIRVNKCPLPTELSCWSFLSVHHIGVSKCPNPWSYPVGAFSPSIMCIPSSAFICGTSLLAQVLAALKQALYPKSHLPNHCFHSEGFRDNIFLDTLDWPELTVSPC